MNDSLLLLSNFVRNPKEVGAVVPSSKFLTNEIIKNIDFEKSKYIVEQGPGLGTMTKLILKKVNQNTTLFCFEVNKKFCNYLSKNIHDKRVKIIRASAEEMSVALRKFDISKVDCIISGIPFSYFPKKKKEKIIQEIKNSLNDNGRFILYQYTNGLSRMLESYFNKVDRKFVAFNVPPSFVYVCEK